MKINHSNPTHTLHENENLSISPKTNSNVTISSPFTLNISAEGKFLSRKLNTDSISSATSELQKIKEEKQYHSKCKERIEVINEQLSRDDITKDEKDKLLDEKNFLEKSSYNSEDALNDAYKLKRDFNKKFTTKECTESDLEVITDINIQLNHYIKEKEYILNKEIEHEQELQLKQIQENSDLDLEKQRAQEKIQDKDTYIKKYDDFIHQKVNN